MCEKLKLMCKTLKEKGQKDIMLKWQLYQTKTLFNKTKTTNKDNKPGLKTKTSNKDYMNTKSVLGLSWNDNSNKPRLKIKTTNQDCTSKMNTRSVSGWCLNYN